MFGMVPAVADREAQPAFAEQVHVGGLFGDQCGLKLRLEWVE